MQMQTAYQHYMEQLQLQMLQQWQAQENNLTHALKLITQAQATSTSNIASARKTKTN
jgi:hypothetical protein